MAQRRLRGGGGGSSRRERGAAIDDHAGASAACPRCGRQLDRGFVAAARGIVWTATRLTFRGTKTKGGPDFHMLHRRHVGAVNIPAGRCAACQLILMDYSQT